MARSIRWAILGTSPISESMARAIQTAENSELIAVAGRHLVKAQRFADKYSIKMVYENYVDVLNQPEVDVVYLGLPNHLHKTWIKQCALAGKHILCEKPLVLTIQEAHEIIDVLRKTHVFCMEALMYRCHPFTKRIEEIIQQKILGDIHFFQAFYSANISSVANPIAGGSIRNLGCYPVSLIRLLANDEPIVMTAMGNINSNGSDQAASLLLKFPDNSMALIGTADNLEMSWQFSILGTKGKLEAITNPWLPNTINELRLTIHQKDPVIIRISADKPLYTYQIELVSNSILQNKKEAIEGVGWQDSVGNIKVLEQWLEIIHQPNNTNQATSSNVFPMSLKNHFITSN